MKAANAKRRTAALYLAAVLCPVAFGLGLFYFPLEDNEPAKEPQTALSDSTHQQQRPDEASLMGQLNRLDQNSYQAIYKSKQDPHSWLTAGDFDGDGKTDHIGLVVGDKNKNQHLPAVFWGHGGTQLLTLQEDLEFPRPQLLEVMGNDNLETSIASPNNARGDLIRITKLESSSALIFWDGERFKSKWIGD